MWRTRDNVAVRFHYHTAHPVVREGDREDLVAMVPYNQTTSTVSHKEEP